MIDTQQSNSEFEFPIERVGITDFLMPIYISRKEGGFQHTVANINAFVDLKEINKGINMSRLPIGIQKFSNQSINASILADIAEHIRNKSEAEQCQLVYNFPYFINKIAPVSKEPGIVHTNITFDVTRSIISNTPDFWLTVETNTTSLCPCSKEISDNSAHNQRSLIKISINPKPQEWIWIEELVDLAEKYSSCEIYSILKRVDEKHVTEKAYNNPKFVEDAIRGCYSELINRQDLKHFRIEVTNYESIHQHNATAIMDSRFKR